MNYSIGIAMGSYLLGMIVLMSFFFFFVELDKFGKENGIERRKKIPIPLRRKELKNK